MADAVANAMSQGEHLLVQAGTGTGKSLGYLSPAIAALLNGDADRVVVATATLALQAQLATSDIPHALAASERVTGRQLVPAVLKGRTNYACLLRVRGGAPDEQGALFASSDVVEAVRDSGADAGSVLGAEVVMLREWAEEQASSGGLADRDEAPAHSGRAWAQVSVPTRECLGVTRCPFGPECLVEESRDRARRADLVVTNHALLAIDAMHGGTALPDYDLLVIDEAHELVGRVTGAASAELSPQMIERVAHRAMPWVADETALELLDAGEDLEAAIADAPLEQIRDPESPVLPALRRVRGAARTVVSGLTSGKDADADRTQAAAAVKEVFDIAERMAGLDREDVVWVSERERFGRQLIVGPLSVAGLMHASVLSRTPVVMTSATLKIGGDFSQVATTMGLWPRDRVDPEVRATEQEADAADDDRQPWRALDVGSPFDYPRQGIVYVASHLPNPRRDGITEEALACLAELVWAAGGRTLGLFASQRSAETAARHVRAAIPGSVVLCQGDAQLSELTRRFIAEPATSLFGTISLWQGIDVPGDTCRLVVIDKIPFPRPDEPLLQARQRAVTEAGGNGFMSVAATHAGLLMAQGSGRLIRRSDDRGMVAVLDPRLLTARYGSFLRASMPDMWLTRDHEVAIQALRRLAAVDPVGSGSAGSASA
ncbi:MAG TPA: ATP-dependent DNA helicase [Propionibacteriaceae bacterium]|nr:ATP-dependent DNA helicase [Propionibacteriaceae bacterium]